MDSEVCTIDGDIHDREYKQWTVRFGCCCGGEWVCDGVGGGGGGIAVSVGGRCLCVSVCGDDGSDSSGEKAVCGGLNIPARLARR